MLKLLCVLLCISVEVVFGAIDTYPRLRTTSGLLIGETVKLDGGQSVHRFLGVPYAEAPVGVHRFEKPRPITTHNRSDSVVMAQSPKPTCVQMPHLASVISPLLDVDHQHNVSEDCLYLNIYVPSGEAKNMPIMVWLPGEGFDFADARQFDGAHLAAHGQVIVITVQYRVGVFGFLANNAGLWDQLTALRWTNANAAQLGGDSDRVTVFGRFSGSMSISILLASPQVTASDTSLFQRAILMSGVAVGDWVFDRRHTNRTAAVIRATKCTSLACLKSLPAGRLLASGGYGWKPTLDSELIPQEPLAALTGGVFPSYVRSVMLGGNHLEGSLCMLSHQFTNARFYHQLMANNATESEYQQAIQADMAMFYEENAQHQPKPKSITGRQEYLHFCSELLVNGPMRQYRQLLNQSHTAANGTSVVVSDGLQDVHHYRLDYRPSFSIAPDFVNSSIHGDDVILAFGLPLKNRFSADDRTIASRMVRMFSHFAHTGQMSEQNQQSNTSQSVFIVKLEEDLTNGKNIQLAFAVIGIFVAFAVLVGLVWSRPKSICIRLFYSQLKRDTTN